MRVLFLCQNAWTNPADETARSFRQFGKWLAEAGHDVSCLCGGTFPHLIEANLEFELRLLSVIGAGRYQVGSRSLVMFKDGAIRGSLVCTSWTAANDVTDRRTLVNHGQRIIRDLRPQLVVVSGHSPALQEIIRMVHGARIPVLTMLWTDHLPPADYLKMASRVIAAGPKLGEQISKGGGPKLLAFPPPVVGGFALSEGTDVVLLRPTEAMVDIAEQLLGGNIAVKVAGERAVAGAPFTFIPNYRSAADFLDQAKVVVDSEWSAVLEAECEARGVGYVVCGDPETTISSIKERLSQSVDQSEVDRLSRTYDAGIQSAAYVRLAESLVKI